MIWALIVTAGVYGIPGIRDGVLIRNWFSKTGLDLSMEPSRIVYYHIGMMSSG